MTSQQLTYAGSTIGLMLVAFLVLFIGASRAEASFAGSINCDIVYEEINGAGSPLPVLGSSCGEDDDSDDGEGDGEGDGDGDTGGGDDGSDDGDNDDGDTENETPDTDTTQSSGGGGGGGGGGGHVLGASIVPTGIACDRYMTAFIKPGGDNDEAQVYRLQALLKTFEGAELDLSGEYDAASVAAVHAFQTKYAADILAPWGIEQSTGFVYLTTRKKMNEVYCANTQQFPLTVEEEKIIERTRLPAAAVAAAAHAVPLKKEEPKKEVVVELNDEEESEMPVVKDPSSAVGDFFRRLFDRFR